MTRLSVVTCDSERRTPPSMLERMTLIMDCFADVPTRRTLEEVARETGLPRSTTHRILVDLARLGWLRQVPNGYALGSRVQAFGGSDGGTAQLREATAPALHDLAMRTGMVVHLAVLSEATVVYLDKVGGRLATSVPSKVGGRSPAHCTALGKAMLAWLPAEQVDSLVGPAMDRHTTRTIARMGTLHLELSRVRDRNGLAYERGECFADLACVASAIRSPEGPVGAISLCGNLEVPLERVAPLVAHAAREASRKLFPHDQADCEAAPDFDVADSWSQEELDAILAVGSHRDWI